MDVKNADQAKKYVQQMQQRIHPAMLGDLTCSCGSKVFRLHPLGMVKFLRTEPRQTDTQPFAFTYECSACYRWAVINDATNKWEFKTHEELEDNERQVAAELEAAKEKVAAESAEKAPPAEKKPELKLVE